LAAFAAFTPPDNKDASCVPVRPVASCNCFNKFGSDERLDVVSAARLDVVRAETLDVFKALLKHLIEISILLDWFGSTDDCI
jgi:hypothetical protein